MAFQGFGKQSGPSGGASLKPETSFGQFPPNPPPPLHSYSREPETQVRSPVFPIESFRPALGPSNAFSVVQRPAGTTPNWGSGKNSTTPPPFPAFNNARPSYPVRNVQVQDMKRIRPPPSLSRDEDHGRNTRNIIVRHSVNQRAPSASPPLGFQNGRHLDDIGSFSDAQRHSVSQRAPSPPFGFQNARHLDDLGSFSDPQRHSVSQRAPSPPSGFQNGRHLDDLGSFSNAQRHSISQRAQSPPPGFQNGGHLDNLGSFSDIQRHSVSQRAQSPPSNFQIGSSGNVQRNSSPSTIRPTVKPSTNFTNSLIQQGLSSVSTNIGTFNSSRNFPSNQEDAFMPNRTRSPPPSYADIASPVDSTFAGDNSKRTSISPPRTSIRPNARFDIPDTRNHRGSPSTKMTNHAVQKRSRSPSFISSDQGFEGDSSAQDETERELQAKAKRLARFKEELSQPEPSNIINQKHPVNRQDRPAVDMQSEPSDMMIGDFRDSADFEAQESSNIIIGLCPDMCPETERGERERKGDLDQYERMGGDRNQTDKSLAVKKYTRTAEREADLIRPMHILQMTLDYLLNLLNQPYDQKFLGLYNFLWDRMRAIRMDLRMQHIFNQGAITMLEQMIRLHIIAMHELCEYTKGEGFSEGFDAHLNIEQMNKTSVELFQLYDDHRKKGIDVPTEKEFRGYYALLKLDKHPGYKVEPAELSLDLAKMTPEIRQTSEIVFARDVARACRTGNYIAFFRLARKASYLQACLMHAHFAKLRSQALAALHSGLQNTQGIPIAQISKWLAMEDEDIENLLDHHGFVIKEFEEPFMVKEGNFLGGENDYPLQCSKLVHNKKSTRIFKDVSSPSLVETFSSRNVKELKPRVISPKVPKRVHFDEIIRSPILIDKKMPDFQAISSPRKIMQVPPLNKPPVTTVIPVEIAVEAKKNSAEKPRIDIFTQNLFKRNLSFDVKATPSQVSPKRVQLQEQILPPLQVDHPVEISVDQSLFIEDFQKDESFDFPEEVEPETEMEEISVNCYDEEVAEAKLRLILRIWKRRCSKRREIRERKQLEANAALSSVSLGPPMWNDKHIEITSGKFNINQVMRERYDEHGKSWSTVNVSEVVASKLSEKNPNSRCLCWKILLISQLEGNKQEQISHLAAGSWLCSKLIPTKDSDEDDLVISTPDLSIWNKWVPNQSNDDTCCLSVIKDTNPSNLNDDSVLGVSAVVFVVYNTIAWKLQKTLLNRLLDSIPSGSRLPLLILIGSEMDSPDSSAVAKELGLHEVDKSRISEYSVISLIEDHSFFSDDQLREGLKWLASESPLQPNLHRLKPCDLVRSHLNPKLEALDQYNGYEVSPNHCISTLNEALDSSLEDIMTSANSNPSYWPCPEMNLLDEYTYEQNAVDMYLPSIGWNLPTRIESLTHAISQCKLPTFSDDISWLFRGSDLGMDTETQRSQLEDCLVRYLSETSRLMGVSLAKKEANVMLQKCARLELQGSTYYIVPKWPMIFRRIFNWRLTSLNSGALSEAYIFESHQSTSNSSIVVFESTDSYMIPPSLDEMVEVGRSPLKPDTYFEARRPPSIEPKNNVIYFVEDDMHFGDRDTEIVSNKRLEVGLVDTGRKETDRLTKLLEQCNIVQNLNAEKLSIYF